MLVLKDSTESFARKQAGGKGYNLYLMTRQGLPVPEWLVLARDTTEEFLLLSGARVKVDEWLKDFSENRIAARSASEEILRLLSNASMPDRIRLEIARAYREASSEGAVSVSIRSSAADEDGTMHSFAGQLSSFLYVSSLDDAVRYVRECWASAFSERALIYRRENGLPLRDIGVAVLVQRMLDPEASGVIFTCDPLEKKADVFVVSAVYGVGEGLVSGELDADTYWLEADTGRVTKQEVVTKPIALRRGASGMCAKAEVCASRRDLPCLDATALAQLHRLGRTVAALYPGPQDIEWALAGGQIYLLQTRPVTTLDENLIGIPNLWDNSNIVESYGGLTSPLSFTFALHNYRNVYVQFCEVLGMPHRLVAEMEPYLGNMLGCIHGRVYYNLYNWYKLIGVLPGFKQNRDFMETMMGVHEKLPADIADRIRPHPSWETPRGRWRRWVTGISFIAHHFCIQGRVDRFLATFHREYENYRRRDYRRMSSDRILAQYMEMDQRMLSHWKAPILNDFLCMVHFGLLRKLTAKWLGRLDENIKINLLTGGGEIESAEPTRALIRLAGTAAADIELQRLIEETSPDHLLETLNQSPFRDFYRQVVDYIDRFGYRCMSEMKLEETDWATDPSFLFACLKNYLRAGTTDLAARERQEQALRAEAERNVAGALRGVKRVVYFWSLKHTRKAIRNRENTRFARTRIYGVARAMFRAMGEDLSGVGILDKSADIFFLTRDEVLGLHQGTLTAYGVKDLVRLRRAEYERFAEMEPRSRFLTRGPVYWRNRFLAPQEAPTLPVDADYDLKGLPCCPGVVEGRVRVIRSPQDDFTLNGEILVAARTDPGWVPLYPSISGLLVERGSLLSHSAIVAREMGIPAIVGIQGLLATLKDGQRIRMNGSLGTVVVRKEGEEGLDYNGGQGAMRRMD
ncbi:MAG: phosphoenolpyruvate synthase [Kiritimatiellia bacterium]|nr:phosphoenolpyruvate synthase [Kiritimatiellia bacterium]